jgi:ABC-type multidrug transport system fused ATPase/permease subunit
MNFYRPTRQSDISAKTGVTPSPLPAEQIAGIYKEIKTCYKQSRASRQSPTRMSESNWLYYGTVIGSFVVFWTVAVILVKSFPHNDFLLKLAQVLFIAGLVPYVGFGLIYLIRFVRIVSATAKRGALGEFVRADARSQIESRFVDGIARYDEKARRFTLTELELVRSDLESWPKHVLRNAGTLAAMLTFVGLPGFFGKLLTPEFVNVANPALSWLVLIGGVGLFFFFLFLVGDSFERVQAVKRMIVLLRFSLGAVPDDEHWLSGEDEVKIETKSDDNAVTENHVPSVDEAIGGV